MRNARGHERTRQRSERLSVDVDAVLFVKTYESVGILPVVYSPFERMVLGIRDIVRNTAAFIRRKTARKRNLGKKPCVGRTVSDLNGNAYAFVDLTADLNAVIDRRETVEQRPALSYTFSYTDLCLLITVKSRITVYRRWKKIRFALFFEVLEKFYVLSRQSYARSGLNKRGSFLLRFEKLLGEILAFGYRMMISDRFFEIHVFTGRPFVKHFLPDRHEFVHGPFAILDFHILIPLSDSYRIFF